MLHVWYIYLENWVILCGQMLLNIPYMEHMGGAFPLANCEISRVFVHHDMMFARMCAVFNGNPGSRFNVNDTCDHICAPYTDNRIFNNFPIRNTLVFPRLLPDAQGRFCH